MFNMVEDWVKLHLKYLNLSFNWFPKSKTKNKDLSSYWQILKMFMQAKLNFLNFTIIAMDLGCYWPIKEDFSWPSAPKFDTRGLKIFST